MATHGAAPDDGGIQALFERSPDPGVHTSAAAELGFLCGLVGLVAAPFAVMHAFTIVVAVAGILLSLVGLVATGRPNVGGGALVPLGLALAATAGLLVGLRYLGVDTAFGDALVPTIAGWLDRLNTLLPRP